MTELRFNGEWSAWGGLMVALSLAILAWGIYRRELGAAGIDYTLLDTSMPLETGLLSYLTARRKAS